MTKANGIPDRKCVECEREFFLDDATDNQEWYYGHDCEANN
jgi:hypothetical protein